MHAELGTEPQIKYLYELPNVSPGRDPEKEDTEDAALGDPANPLVGERQTFWDYRAAMNFILGGMSTGLIVMGTFAHFFFGLSSNALLYLNGAAGFGMGIGLFFVFMEIGRKARFLRVLMRPQTSWMTRETYAVAIFYPALLADLIWPTPQLHLLVALTALAFLYCQSRILHPSKGVPAWRNDLIPTMLMMTGLLEGIGLLAIAAGLYSSLFGASAAYIAAVGIFLATCNALIWQQYYANARQKGLSPLARAELERITPKLRVLGHLIPIVMFAVGIASSEAFFVIAGAAAVAGGILWKFTVITRASHLQGFALPKMPQRGSGTRAAPTRIAGRVHDKM